MTLLPTSTKCNVCMRAFMLNGWIDYGPIGEVRVSQPYRNSHHRMFFIQEFLNSIQLTSLIGIITVDSDNIVYYTEN